MLEPALDEGTADGTSVAIAPVTVEGEIVGMVMAVAEPAAGRSAFDQILAVALAAGVSPIVVVAMGVVTGTFGGLIRDVVGNELPMVLKQGELYVTAAFGGAVVAMALIGVVTIVQRRALATIRTCHVSSGADRMASITSARRPSTSNQAGSGSLSTRMVIWRPSMR